MYGERLLLFILSDCILKQLFCATKVSDNVQMELSPTFTYTMHYVNNGTKFRLQWHCNSKIGSNLTPLMELNIRVKTTLFGVKATSNGVILSFKS